MCFFCFKYYWRNCWWIMLSESYDTHFHWSNVALSLFIPRNYIWWRFFFDSVSAFLILCLRFKIVSKLLTTETTIRGNVKYYRYIVYRKPMTPGYIHVPVCTLLQLGTSTGDCTAVNQFLIKLHLSDVYLLLYFMYRYIHSTNCSMYIYQNMYLKMVDKF